ncbi:MAG: DUF3574 domain-containing protein [Candidatus Tectomicrobia bacterium]|nr:DUF3574 domain-containing protein [Candidatus Tectomicrobia bacterium]
MRQRRLIEISIYLPLYCNPDPHTGKRRRIERAKFEETYQEILEKFEGYSLFQHVKGVWVDPTGRIVTDTHHVVFILTEETPQLEAWLQRYKQTLAMRFEQQEIFMTMTQTRRI